MDNADIGGDTMSKYQMLANSPVFINTGSIMVQYEKGFKSFSQALAEAKELSFSLGSSAIPKRQCHFELFRIVSEEEYESLASVRIGMSYTLMFDEWGNNPTCGVAIARSKDWGIGEDNIRRKVFYYQTSSGKAQFAWVPSQRKAYVRLETAEIAVSRGYKNFTGAGWSPYMM